MTWSASSKLETTKPTLFSFTKSAFDKYPHLFEKITNLKIIDENEIILKKSSLNHQVFSYKHVDYYTHLIFKQNRINLTFLIEFLISIHAFNFKYIIKKIKRVEGRLDLVHTRPYVLIDNAHSKQSVENVLKDATDIKIIKDKILKYQEYLDENNIVISTKYEKGS